MRKLVVDLPRMLAFAGFILTLNVVVCWAEEVALARLSFWVPPERMAAFEAAYKEQFVPILKKQGLVESTEQARTTVDSVFSRLFVFKSASELIDKLEVIKNNPLYREALRDFRTIWAPVGTDLLRFGFGHYATPVGSGRRVLAGTGKIIPAGRGTAHWRNYDVTDGLAGLDVAAIVEDREGRLWFGIEGSGVSRYDGREFTTFTTQDGLAGNNVYSILQDTKGHLWFGTLGGVSRYDGREFITFTTDDGLAHNFVWSILQDQEGHLWFGTNGGASRYDRKVWTTLTTSDGLPHNIARSLLQDRKGHLWFGTDGGVSRYDGQQFVTFTADDGLADNWVWSMLEDQEGHLWFGTNGGGVSRYDGREFITFTADDGLTDNRVWSMLEDQEGRLWFSTDGGLSRYDRGEFTTYTTKDGLAHNQVWSMLEDQEGHLWFGTRQGGVSRYDGQKFITFTTKDGLAHNSLRSILEDQEGRLWFGTDGGVVSRYDGQVFQTLTYRDGLTGHSVRSILQDQEGTIWFATYNGITRYHPPPPSPPPVFIDAVVADRRYTGVSELALPSSIKLTTFEFHGRSFKTRPNGMVYKYRMKGYDKVWKTTNAQHVEYLNLPRGTYTFEVAAVDRDLVYSEVPATMTLHVNPPYERIGWISALSITILLAVWQAGRIVQRDRRLQEANRQIQEANRLKSDFLSRMSHDLRTPMNAIIGYNRILLRQVKDLLSERQYRNLNNIQVSANNLLVLINDILDLSKIEAGRIDIKPEKINLKQLTAECIVAVESLVKPEVQFVQHLTDVNPVYTDADRIRRVVMNLLSNALKFTEQGSITVSLKAFDNGVEVAVADTGSGIPSEDLPYIFDEFRQVEGESGKTQEGTGLGLSIAKKSVELLGGTIEVESEVGKGTKFTLQFTDYEVKKNATAIS